MRSTASGSAFVEVITVETAEPSRPGMASTSITSCDRGPTVKLRVTLVPFSFRNCATIGASTVFGFATSTSRSKKLPVAPSASV